MRIIIDSSEVGRPGAGRQKVGSVKTSGETATGRPQTEEN